MRRSLLVLLLAAASTVSGCATVDSLVERVGGAEDEVVTPTVTIGVLAPLSGGQTRVGRSVVDAVEQAVADAPGVPGWQIEVEAYDLAGESLADDLAELKVDDSTVAVVTGFGADDVRTVVPELDESGLTVVSPADSDPRHVRGAIPDAPVRPWSGYVTVAVDPAPEQTALADHLVRVRDVERVVLVTDGTRESAARVAAVERGLDQRGVSDVRSLAWTGEPSRSDQRILDRLRPGDAVVVDASAEVSADVAAALDSGVLLALTSPLPDLSPRQARALDGAMAPLAGLDPKRGGRELSAAFSASGRDATESPYGPAAYDGTRLLLDSFTRCLPDVARSSSPSRSGCLAEVAGSTWSGLTGLIQFDEFGARLGLLPAVVTLREEQWGQPGG